MHPKIEDKDGNVTGEVKDKLVFTFKGAVPMPETLNICSGSTTDRAVACILYEKGIYKHERLDTINKYSLPGEADYRYFYQNVEETEKLIKEIYNFKYKSTSTDE